MKTITMLSTCVVMLCTAAWSQNSWTLQNPAASPPELAGHAMSCIGGDKVVLFGGGFPSSNQTWVYDRSDNQWTLMDPSTVPAARTGASMATLGDDKVLLFGGAAFDESFNYVTVDPETWVYDLSDNNWTLMNPSTQPSARWFHSMANIGGDNVVLIGGNDASDPFATWVYNLIQNSWTSMNPSYTPSFNIGTQSMASLDGDRVVLVAPASPVLTSIYDLSANTWTNQSPATGPGIRGNMTMASLAPDKAILFGGLAWEGGEPYYGDTWIYDASDNAWTEISSDTHPGARYLCAASETGTNTVVLFGGWPPDAQTWIFTATQDEDTESPSISCPSNATYRPTSLSGRVVSYEVTATDNTSVTLTQIAGIASGSTFPIGTTTNTFVATDGAGNTAGCSFTITIIDPHCTATKVNVCHNGNTLCVSVSSMNEHLAHGDLLGPCTLARDAHDEIGESAPSTPSTLQLRSISPNPMNHSTTISYSVAEAGIVRLSICDVLGRTTRIISEDNKSAGQYAVQFDASDLPEGMYYFVLESGNTMTTSLISLIR